MVNSKIPDLGENYFNMDFHKYIEKYAFLCWILSLLYLIAIFVGKKIMEDRQKFNIRQLLVAWSAFLAIGSIIGTVRMAPLFYKMWTENTVYIAICHYPLARYSPEGRTMFFWSAMFAYSKVIELGDTAFIVLRKQPLIFLHWYHHITVLLYVWYANAEHAAPGLWFMFVNCTVHAFMYTYYTFAALGYKVPTSVKKLITCIQLSQMVFGCCINAYVTYVKLRGYSCWQTDGNLISAIVMYSSYLLLFAKFYLDAYVKRSISASKVADTIKCIPLMEGSFNGKPLVTKPSNGVSKRLHDTAATESNKIDANHNSKHNLIHRKEHVHGNP